MNEHIFEEKTKSKKCKEFQGLLFINTSIYLHYIIFIILILNNRLYALAR